MAETTSYSNPPPPYQQYHSMEVGASPSPEQLRQRLTVAGIPDWQVNGLLSNSSNGQFPGLEELRQRLGSSGLPDWQISGILSSTPAPSPAATQPPEAQFTPKPKKTLAELYLPSSAPSARAVDGFALKISRRDDLADIIYRPFAPKTSPLYTINYWKLNGKHRFDGTQPHINVYRHAEGGTSQSTEVGTCRNRKHFSSGFSISLHGAPTFDVGADDKAGWLSERFAKGQLARWIWDSTAAGALMAGELRQGADCSKVLIRIRMTEPREGAIVIPGGVFEEGMSQDDRDQLLDELITVAIPQMYKKRMSGTGRSSGGGDSSGTSTSIVTAASVASAIC